MKSMELETTPNYFLLVKTSERFKEEMISDKKLANLIDELNSHFNTRHPVPWRIARGP
jgi:hypothetical protein